MLMPKNATMASRIVHLVKLNKQYSRKLARFCLHFVQDVAFLLQIHTMQLPKLFWEASDYLKIF